jgi:D-amino-acid dehydrogenase
MDVAVVGGGVIGLSAAEALSRRGAKVTVLEGGAVGAAASAGNAGWITPGLSAPVPAPGTMLQALKWMPNPGSPLLVRPVPRASFLRWSYDFWRSTASHRYGAGMAALVALSDRTIGDFEALRERGVQFEMHAQGMLFVARTESALEDELAALRDQQALGYRGGVEVLDRAGAMEREPGLADGVVGAIFADMERHVRPETLTRGLAEHLRAAGAEIREGVRVRRVLRRGGGWTLETDGGEEVRAERVVLAGGVETSQLLAPLGVRLPLEGAKGYSITLEQPPVALRSPLYLLESKVGVSPYDGALRLAGTLELGAKDLRLSARRIASIERSGRAYLRSWPEGGARNAWAGFRPLLPDGLPAIGPVPGHEGLHVATGHSMLGVTLAPATAEVLAPAVLGGEPSLELAPFSIARFGNRVPSNPAVPA